MGSLTEESAQGSKSNGMATTAKVLGITSIFLALSIPAVGLLFAIVAIVLGRTSLKSHKSSAVTAISTGAVATFLALLMLFIPIMYAGIQQRAEQTRFQNAQRTQPGE